MSDRVSLAPVDQADIPRTVEELAAIGPSYVIPGHFTGWRAVHEVARRLPEAYDQPSVGARPRFVRSLAEPS